MDTKIGERIRNLRKYLKLSQEKFSGQAGVERTYLAVIEKGNKPPSFNFIMSLIDTFDVNANWLLKGEGDMQRPPASTTSNEDKELQDILRELTLEQRQELLNRGREMIKVKNLELALAEFQTQRA